MQLQGTVDHRSHFINVAMGYSGTYHDAVVFKESSIKAAMDAQLFVPNNPTIRLGGVTIPPMILGDRTYTLRT